jgi:PLP dependent protein
MNSIAGRLAAIREEIAEAAKRAGRDPASVRLCAVSKTFPVEAIREAMDAGQALFGESRVQEAVSKIPQLPPAHWHFIGHLQSNKIRKVLPLCGMFHSVDGAGLALDINRIAAETGRRPQVLLQVNVAGDAAKFGFDAASVSEAFSSLLDLPNIEIRGLMTIPPLADDPEKSRPHFAALRKLRDQLSGATGAHLPELSMGMSGDFAQAIAEGATIVRVGSAIFGDR